MVTAPAFTIRSSDFIGSFGQREEHGRWQGATPACVPRGEYTPHPSRGGLAASSFHPATGIAFFIFVLVEYDAEHAVLNAHGLLAPFPVLQSPFGGF